MTAAAIPTTPKIGDPVLFEGLASRIVALVGDKVEFVSELMHTREDGSQVPRFRTVANLPDILWSARLGNAVDLTGATCKFSMRDSRLPTFIPVNLVNGSLNNGPLGKLGYQWIAGDTDVPGTYEAEFLVDPVVGQNFRVPTRGYITVIIEAKVA